MWMPMLYYYALRCDTIALKWWSQNWSSLFAIIVLWTAYRCVVCKTLELSWIDIRKFPYKNVGRSFSKQIQLFVFRCVAHSRHLQYRSVCFNHLSIGWLVGKISNKRYNWRSRLNCSAANVRSLAIPTIERWWVCAHTIFVLCKQIRIAMREETRTQREDEAQQW